MSSEHQFDPDGGGRMVGRPYVSKDIRCGTCEHYVGGFCCFPFSRVPFWVHQIDSDCDEDDGKDCSVWEKKKGT